MENYKILERLGRGAQGTVYLVSNNKDNQYYVLKKVECSDEVEANKAFKEAMALQELQHSFICGYKEFFVMWDKEESAMFVCIVMEYYKMGDLEKVLKQKREKLSAIEELVIKKWIGQMVDALIFVHKKKVIHRDLKPSNIFITEDLNISIGDFGVSTILGEARTRTRTTVGSMNWMAPEVLEKPYDERSDVWSLGCILLELATCGHLDRYEISSALFEVKSNPQKLEVILEQISQTYSAALCQLIRTMLRRNFQQRPTAQELVELPFVQQCLSLNDSKHIKHDAINMNKEVSDKKQSVKPLPTGKGVTVIFSYMKENENVPECQNKAFVALKDIVGKQSVAIDVKGKMMVASMMRKHIVKEDVQTSACRLLAALATEAESGDILFSQQMIKPVALAMKSHPDSQKLQAAATQLLMALSADEGAAEEIGRLGGVQDTLAALRTFPMNVEIAINCCSALWSLAIDEGNGKIISAERGLQDITIAMDTHAEVAEVIEAACSAVWSLSMDDDNIEMMADIGVVPALIHALVLHKKDAKVVKNAYMAIASIVEADESFAYEILSGQDEKPGSTILINAFKCHKSNDEVVENFACCIAELAEYDDLRTELVNKKVHELLEDIKLKFANNGDVINQINDALLSLRNPSNGQKRSSSARSRVR